VTEVNLGSVMATVKVRLDGGDQTITASITKEAAEELGLAEGRGGDGAGEVHRGHDRRRVARPPAPCAPNDSDRRRVRIGERNHVSLLSTQ
jgi:TOBE domain